VDVYALGVIAFQLLIGDLRREMGPAWRAELEEKNLPASLLDVVAACVDVPSKRYANANVLLGALDGLDLIEPGKKKERASRGEVVCNHCIRCGAAVQQGDAFCTQCGCAVRSPRSTPRMRC
jgi:hypothetical protein